MDRDEDGMKQTEFWQEIYKETNRFYRLLFVLSGVILTAIMTINYSVIIEYTYHDSSDYRVNLWYVLAAAVVMLPVYWYLAYKRSFVERVIEKISNVSGWMAFAVAGAVFFQLIQDTQKNYSHIMDALRGIFTNVDWERLGGIGYKLFLPGMCAAAFFAIFFVVLGAVERLGAFFYEIYKTADKREKMYAVLSLIYCLSLIGIFYAKTHAQWTSIDLIYQTDSAFVYDHYYPVFSYGYDYDWDIGNGGIRHPLTTLYTYPIYIVVSFLSNLLFFIPYIRPILYAVIQSMMMIMTVILLRRMIKNDWIFVIFNLSFPFMFFTIFIEKYQLATLFLVMYAYSVTQEQKKEVQAEWMIAAGGTMITSTFLGFFYGKEKKLRAKLKEYLSLAGAFFLTLAGTGRIGYILNFPYLMNHNFVMFNGRSILSRLPEMMMARQGGAMALNGMTVAAGMGIPLVNFEVIPLFLQNVCAFFNMLASCFVPIPFGLIKDWENKDIFYWTSVKSELNLLGVAIFICLICVFIRHRKEKIVQIFSVWILWAIIQFALIGFSAGCSPLFSLYFGWAVVPMVLIGLRDVLRRPLPKLIGYGTIAVLMLYMNYTHLAQLYGFMVLTSPLG